MMEHWKDIRKKTVEDANLIHCITSPIAINDCANAVLALGAKPIMAQHPEEVREITAIAKALTLSYANITDDRRVAMFRAAEEAGKRKIPVVLDAVGVTCSALRMDDVTKMIRENHPTVIKGNLSEIKALAGLSFQNSGIDVGKDDAHLYKEKENLEGLAKKLADYAVRTGAIVISTGEVDVITDGRTICYVRNGSSHMAKITGTGCILNCILGVYLGSVDPVDKEALLKACALSVVTMGIAGELADASHGLGTYHVSFMDRLSLMDDETLEQYAKIRWENL